MLRARLKNLVVTLSGIAMSGAAAAPDPLTAPMSFRAEDDTAVSQLINQMYNGGERKIYAVGAITDGTVDRFKAFVRDNGITSARVLLNSPGGSLVEGTKFGEAIRRLHFDTTIATENDKLLTPSTAICASTCAYAYAGGVNRFLDRYSGRLGLHQFYAADRAPTDAGVTQQISGMLVSYLQLMGVDATAFSVAALSKPEGIDWLTIDDAQRLHFSNNGASPTTAELKMLDMTPYLKLEQVQFNFTGRVLFLCHSKHLSIMAGVVTSPTGSREHVAGLSRAYLELDGKEAFVVAGPTAAAADQNVVWIQRALTPASADSLLNTKSLGMWTESGPTFRWGGSINLSTVHKPMQSYFAQCLR